MKTQQALEEIITLDKEITALVKKRSSLLSRIRTKGYIPSEIEKKLRQHWESNASELTKDNAFIRTLFKILQQIELQEGGELSPGKFILTPSKAPASFSMQGTSSTTLTHLALLYASASGSSIALQHSAICDSLFSTIKMLQTLGIAITWEGTNINIAPSALSMQDVVLHLGNSPFALYCALALSVNIVGNAKYVGGLPLSLLDLSLAKSLLAECGVRITSLGGVSGIPARVESTKQTPEALIFPEQLSKELVLALCTVAPTWGHACVLDVSKHKEKEEIVEHITQLYTLLEIQYEHDGYTFTIPKTQSSVVENPNIPLDPCHSFIRLLVPYFTGGTATLQGVWGNGTIYAKVVQQLQALGLNIYNTETSICAERKKAPDTISFMELPTEYFPLLFVAFLAFARQHPNAIIPTIPPQIEQSELDSFLEALSIEVQGETLSFAKEYTQQAWVAPSPVWAIAYAYASFLRPAIVLANPSDVTEILPNFWRFFNGLPNPIEHEQIIKEVPTTTKRRILIR